jgi:hypothetical protein
MRWPELVESWDQEPRLMSVLSAAAHKDPDRGEPLPAADRWLRDSDLRMLLAAGTADGKRRDEDLAQVNIKSLLLVFPRIPRPVNVHAIPPERPFAPPVPA